MMLLLQCQLRLMLSMMRVGGECNTIVSGVVVAMTLGDGFIVVGDDFEGGNLRLRFRLYRCSRYAVRRRCNLLGVLRLMAFPSAVGASWNLGMKMLPQT